MSRASTGSALRRWERACSNPTARLEFGELRPPPLPRPVRRPSLSAVIQRHLLGTEMHTLEAGVPGRSWDSHRQVPSPGEPQSRRSDPISVRWTLLKRPGFAGDSVHLRSSCRTSTRSRPSAEVPVDPDRIHSRLRVDSARSDGRPVNAHHRDLVTGTSGVPPTPSSRSARARSTADERSRACSLA